MGRVTKTVTKLKPTIKFSPQLGSSVEALLTEDVQQNHEGTGCTSNKAVKW
jgi:hypothetical protein